MIMVLALGACASAETAEKTVIRVGSMKGPTTMGIVKLMQDDKAETALNDYEFTMAGTADEIVPLLMKGDLDAALVPANLASVLYNKTKGTEQAIQVVGINTLGVLYVLEAGETIQSVEDLRGKTIYSTGKGTTPEYGLNYVLSMNGIDPAKDVTVEFKSEATEVAAALANGAATIAVLPQPFVTATMMQNENLRVALSLTDEWAKVNEESAMLTGVAIIRKSFIEENPEAVDARFIFNIDFEFDKTTRGLYQSLSKYFSCIVVFILLFLLNHLFFKISLCLTAWVYGEYIASIIFFPFISYSLLNCPLLSTSIFPIKFLHSTRYVYAFVIIT